MIQAHSCRRKFYLFWNRCARFWTTAEFPPIRSMYHKSIVIHKLVLNLDEMIPIYGKKWLLHFCYYFQVDIVIG